ncbi:hypothetical protein [Teredinibacter turnerae]|uniref:hypothetical protein n=1 Tax=Teredinibacter turnerae TaxID=2426 RepID=UPI000361DC89|nr:hypothetical protein [Teredinibacter turnerae]
MTLCGKIASALLALLALSVSAGVWSAEKDKTQELEVESRADATYYKLESTFVGDKEQPAVSYFIPWQGTSTPDKLQWNLDVKHDGTLNLVDRDVMVRSMNVYDEMNLETPVAAE